jgi:hypothetical protein
MKSTRYSCLILETLEFSRQIFDKYPNIKFHENPSSGSRIVPRGQRRTGGQTGLPKPMVDFWNFATAPKNCIKVRQRTSSPHRSEQMNTNYCVLYAFYLFVIWTHSNRSVDEERVALRAVKIWLITPETQVQSLMNSRAISPLFFFWEGGGGANHRTTPAPGVLVWGIHLWRALG